jgi:thioredoxin 1
MSDAEDELEAIRQRKRERLEAKLRGDVDAATSRDAGTQQVAPSEPIHVDGPDHFREVVSEYDTVLVDFYADWCGPCQMLTPIVEDLAADTAAAVAKVDSDDHQGLAIEYDVSGLPTLLVFSAGDVVERVTGVREKAHLERLIERHS